MLDQKLRADETAAFCQQMRSESGTPRPALIALASGTAVGVREKLESAGVDAVIAGRHEVRALLRAIARLNEQAEA